MPDSTTTLVARAQWWVLAATVVLVPLVFSRWTFDVFNITEVTVLWVGVVVASSLQLPRFASGIRSPLPTVWPYAAAYLAVFAAATAISRAPAVSLLGIYGRLGGLVTLVPAVLLAWLVHGHLAGSPGNRRRLLAAMATSSLIGGLYLLAQQLDLDTHPWLEFQGREPTHPPGLLGNSNFSGAHVAIGVGPMVWLAARGQRNARALWLVGLAVSLAGVGVSQSRGAMLAATVALVVTTSQLRLPRRVLVVGVAVALAALVVPALAVASVGFDDLTSNATADERLELWEVALRGSTDHLLIGGGPDLYLLTFEEHAGPELAGVVADEPHNVLLDHLDGAGLLGAGAWLAVVAAVFAAARATGRRDLAPWAGMGAAYLTQAMLSIDAVPLLVWGWVIAAGLIAPIATPASPIRPARASRTALVLGLGVGVVGVLLAIQPFRADMAHRRGVVAANAGDQRAALFQFEQATERHGWEPRYHRRLGLELWNAAPPAGRAELLDARSALDEAIDLFPDDPSANAWRAGVERQLAALDD